MSQLSALTASLLMAAVACMGQTKPVPAHTAPPAAKAPVKQAMLSDAQIEATIRAKFARSKISVEKFTVHVQGGVATIEGKTNVIQRKGTATRLAKTGAPRSKRLLPFCSRQATLAPPLIPAPEKCASKTMGQGI
jgi:hypothetical protein